MLELRGKKTPTMLLIMETLSREYGWTPLEIMQQPASALVAYMSILEGRAILNTHNHGH